MPLSDSRYACGRVLHVPSKADSLYLNARIFLAGLMDWSASGPPTSGAIAGRQILAQGRMHVAAIRDTGSLIIGQRDLELDGLTGLREISHRGGGTVWLYHGGQRLRPATGEERRTLPVMSVWGRQVIQLLAEKHFVDDPIEVGPAVFPGLVLSWISARGWALLSRLRRPGQVSWT